MATLLDKIKKDVKKGIEEGIAVVKEGANVVSEKVGEVTAEGKRQLKLYEMRKKIDSLLSALGVRVCQVFGAKKNPASDEKVKAIYAKIQKLEGQMIKLGGGEKAAPKKPAGKTKAAGKKVAASAMKKVPKKVAKKVPAKK
jgi:hypothetical protein